MRGRPRHGQQCGLKNWLYEKVMKSLDVDAAVVSKMNHMTRSVKPSKLEADSVKSIDVKVPLHQSLE